MKLNKLLLGALAVGLLGACSDRDVPASPDTENGPKEAASGYLALQINLPQETGTRADEENKGVPDNVEFADGTPEEYKVNTISLLLFQTTTQGALEDAATFLSSWDMDKSFWPTSPSDGQITASCIDGVEVSVSDDSAYLWAMVMINRPATGVAMPSSPTEEAAGQTFGNYRQKIVEAGVNFSDNTRGIFMTNAPLSNKAGGTVQDPSTQEGFRVSTLVKLGKASEVIKGTLKDAKENPAGCIYVERAVAKVTAYMDKDKVSFGTEENDRLEFYGEDGNTAFKDVDVDVEASFGLRNINPKSYVVRNVKDFPSNANSLFGWNYQNNDYYRMVGAAGMPALYAPLHLDDKYLYRTYWCVDPNYDSALVDDDNAMVETAETGYVNTDGKSPLYVKENTFDVTRMTYGNSTLGVFKVKFSLDPENDQNLYILNDNHQVIYKTLKDVTSTSYAYVFAQEDLAKALTEAVNDTKKASIPAGETIEISDAIKKFVIIEYERDNLGILEVTGIVLKGSGSTWTEYFGTGANDRFQVALTKYGLNTLPARLDANFEIKEYIGGVSYYQIPIMHFGQASTPWTETEGKNQTTTVEAYGTPGNDRSMKYLGRYGLVRNNWYHLELQTLKAIGSPVVPTIEVNLSNDNQKVKQYIGLETHILSWAKRNQGVGF